MKERPILFSGPMVMLMTEFLDGPAEGKKLMLRRAPKFLRVTISKDGTIDALDALADKPIEGEEVIAYRIVPGTFTRIHLRYGGKSKSMSGWYQVAQYRVIESQPGCGTLWDTEEWQAWCIATDKLSVDEEGVS